MPLYGARNATCLMPDTGLMLQKIAECHYHSHTVSGSRGSTASGPRQADGSQKGKYYKYTDNFQSSYRTKERNLDTGRKRTHRILCTRRLTRHAVIQMTVPMADF
ncbi:uncharacterized protein TRIVIDRAFT_110542 [Trichoderma virens Gv29-8]|uniref:Uncharacterized protein n=1 Tax=Hypocrea virens (strain Gv29-8 / FGSC 10586) TaxID=413071 RepID=G9MRT5_HYPVG|nr:uncharacterized protein TRIVIDRAFT_110542 [Trichoderma virens Gv29-8]EHK22804.1 hypothetical protein TRIVIDRAFT_110542 [Trichoderma virens Gv29-8]